MADRILVVDDESIIRESIGFILKKEGFVVEEASNGREALAMHRKSPYDVVITDIEMPEMKGIELLEKIRRETPESLVVIITAFGSIETAVDSLRKGAADYILKPLNFDDLLHRIKKLIAYRSLILENLFLRGELQKNYAVGSIIGQAPSMTKVFQLIQRVATSDGTVLIRGKSGTGKELVARAIHFAGKRNKKRFIAVNCGAIVETLFESELFGHKKGSFTGATMDKDGMFKVADGGTIFLDEVSEIPLSSQVKFLRVLEEEEIIPVGRTEPIDVDVRIIAATNKDLRKEVEQKRFREDLFYRLNVVEIDLPSLAERREDIPLLANHFLEMYRKQMGKRIRGFSNDAMGTLMQYPWQGEVRELENAVERAVIFCDGEMITAEHLPDHMNTAVAKETEQALMQVSTLKDAMKNFERQFIIRMLLKFKKDRAGAAQALGVSLSSLYRKIEELNIT